MNRYAKMQRRRALAAGAPDFQARRDNEIPPWKDLQKLTEEEARAMAARLGLSVKKSAKRMKILQQINAAR